MHSIHLWRTNSSRRSNSNKSLSRECTLCMQMHIHISIMHVQEVCLACICDWLCSIAYMYTFYSAPAPALQHDLEQCRHNDCVTIIVHQIQLQP